jgi:hypothetical protein
MQKKEKKTPCVWRETREPGGTEARKRTGRISLTALKLPREKRFAQIGKQNEGRWKG